MVAVDLLAVDANPLGKAQEVRRGEKSGAKATLAKDRIGERRTGSLAVGARDVHRRHVQLRMPDTFEREMHALQAKRNPLAADLSQPSQKATVAVASARRRCRFRHA